MLPEFLVGSYLRYKEDTNALSTWLAQSAMTCGYTPTPVSTARRIVSNSSTTSDSSAHSASSSGSVFSATSSTSTSSSISAISSASAKIKGEGRVLGKKKNIPVFINTVSSEESVILLGTKDLIAQAEVVSKQTDPPVTLPSSVHRAGVRAIRTRKRFLEWFQQARDEDKEENAAHAYFITILERILGILEPCYESGRYESSTNLNTAEASANVANRFEMLDVEDILDGDLEFVASDFIAKNKSSAAIDMSIDSYDIDMDPEMDLPFIIFCFFEDLHRIQDFLQDTWRKYAQGKLDLATAALVTTLALDVVRDEEANLMASIPDSHFRPDLSTYAMVFDIIHDIYFTDDRQSSAMRDKLPKEAPKSFCDFTYYSTYATIFKTVYTLQNCRSEGIAPAIPPLSLTMFDSKLEGADQWAREGWQDEDIKLTQFLLDLSFKTTEINGTSDELTDILQPILSEPDVRKIAPLAVFGASVLVDIWRTLENKIGEPYKEVLQKGANAKAAITYTSPHTLEWDFAREDFQEIWEYVHNDIEYTCVFPNKQKWIYQVTHPQTDVSPEALARNIYLLKQESSHDAALETRNLSKLSSRFTDTHQPCEIEIEICDIIKARKLHTSWIGCSPNPVNYVESNPIWCGTRVLELGLMMERSGLEFMLSNGSAFSVAHVYNAGQQIGVVKGKWIDLDRYIEANMHDVFTGGIPKTPREIYMRSMLGMGYSSSNFVRYRRDNNIQWRDVLQKFKQPDISEFLENAYYNAIPAQTGRFMITLRNLAQASFKQPNSSSSKTSTRYTPLPLLMELRDLMPPVIARMEIDYITLTRKCDVLMEHLHDRLSHQHNFRISLKTIRGVDNFHLMLAITKHQFNHDMAFSDVTHSPILVTAAQVVWEYMQQNARWRAPVPPFPAHSFPRKEALTLQTAAQALNPELIPFSIIRSLTREESYKHWTHRSIKTTAYAQWLEQRSRLMMRPLEPGMKLSGKLLGGNAVLYEDGYEPPMENADGLTPYGEAVKEFRVQRPLSYWRKDRNSEAWDDAVAYFNLFFKLMNPLNNGNGL